MQRQSITQPGGTAGASPANNKLGSDLSKIFSWIQVSIEAEDNMIKKRRAKEAANGGEYSTDETFESKSTRDKIIHVLKFLDIDPTEEEIRAIEDMMLDLGESNFKFSTLEKVFIRSPQEKLKEYDHLLSAFRALKTAAQKEQSDLKNSNRDLADGSGEDLHDSRTKEAIQTHSQDKSSLSAPAESEFILLKDLGKIVQDYQGNYERSFKSVQDDLQKSQFVKGDLFFYKEYLDEVYKINTLKPPDPAKPSSTGKSTLGRPM